MIAAIITASAALLTALALVVTSVTVLLPMLRISKSTHTIVNKQRTDLIRYQRALIAALEAKGIDVPVDQSIEQPPK